MQVFRHIKRADRVKLTGWDLPSISDFYSAICLIYRRLLRRLAALYPPVVFRDYRML